MKSAMPYTTRSAIVGRRGAGGAGIDAQGRVDVAAPLHRPNSASAARTGSRIAARFAIVCAGPAAQNVCADTGCCRRSPARTLPKSIATPVARNVRIPIPNDRGLLSRSSSSLPGAGTWAASIASVSRRTLAANRTCLAVRSSSSFPAGDLTTAAAMTNTIGTVHEPHDAGSPM